MATLTLTVPDDLLRRAKARLDKHGNSDKDVQEYLLSVLESLTTEGEPIDADTEAKLLEGLKSPAREMTEADWATKLDRYDARHRKRKRA
jgi:hypothetical protein